MKRKRRWIYYGNSIRNGRNINMDSVLLKEGNFKGVQVVLAAVCDGVGSLSDGAFASSRIVKLLNSWLDGISGFKCIGIRLLEQVNAINREIIEEARRDRKNTASTLSLLMVVGDKYYIVHFGDSRIYAFHNGEMEQLTPDQSENGALTSYLGRKEQVEAFYGEGDITDSTFLLCSDGLYKTVSDRTIADALRSVNSRNIKRTVRNLLNEAINRGESDNISVAILYCE